MCAQRDAFLSALSTLHVGGKYSDLTIRCKTRQWAVHRAILCPRSTFFDGACSSKFLEAETGVIDLSEDDEDAVDHMINYLYRLDYLAEPDPARDLPHAEAGTQRQRTAHLPVKELRLDPSQDPLFAQAAAYVPPTPAPSEPPTSPAPNDAAAPAPPLKVRSRGSSQRPQLVRSTTESDAESEPEDDYDTDDSHLLAHTRVYALAEKYDIPALKTLSQGKFEVAMACFYDSPEFADAVEEVYNSTVDSDRGLRNVVLQAFRNHPQLANTQDVYAVIKHTPSLAFELWKTERGIPV